MTLLLGLLGVAFAGPITGIPAIILGYFLRHKFREYPKSTAYKNATAGLWMGCVSIALTLLLGVLILILYKQLVGLGIDPLELLL